MKISFGTALILVSFLGGVFGVVSWSTATMAKPKANEAKSAIPKTTLNALKDILSRYQKSTLVELDLEKKVIVAVMGTERVHKGKAFLAAKRFRLETFEPEKTLIVYDGSTLWNVQYPPEESGGKVQIAKAKLDKKNQNQVLLGDLLVEQGLLNKFYFVDAKKDGDNLEITAKPKSSQIQVIDLKFRLQTKERVIQEIEYSDELGNTTIMKFSNTQFKKKKNAKLFQYSPDKGAQVTEL